MHRRAARHPRRAIFVVILLLILLGSGIGASFLALNVIMAGNADLPKLADQQQLTAAQTSQIFAADGSSLAYLFGEVNRTIIASRDISPLLKYAVVAIEDKRFYQHNGVDYVRLGRVIEINIRSNAYAQGASTITQQLVGSLYLDRRDITITRKIREASLAQQYEKQYSKDEILTQYLNTVYFGANAYGAEAAAQTYFGKTPNELTLPEAAMLAGMPQAPSAYNPRRNPDKALVRRNEVLAAMWEQGYITGEQYDEAYETPIKLAPYSPYQQVREPYVVDFVKQQLIDMFGKDRVFKGGLRVQTTIDPKWQELARKAIKSVLDRKNDPSAAIVSLDPNTGYIRAMASSGDYDKTKFNLAAQMHRQPGSAFKPFCLVAALEQGMNPATTVYRSGPQAIHIPGTNETRHVNNFGDGY
jgi:penicillin-binding protein 1A